MSYQLGKNILATVTYYDVMNFPLTFFEIWKHLVEHDRENVSRNQEISLQTVWNFLATGQLSSKISEKNGMYFLIGRESLVDDRIRSEKISVAKLKRMKGLARILAYVPYLRMLGATGSLAMKNGVRGSDWDMFVVLQSGKIWIGRTILTLFLQCIGKRRHGKKIHDRACLNYFVTDNTLEIGTKDLFSAHEYRFLIPLLSFSAFQNFEIKNRWIKLYKPNFAPTCIPSLWLVKESKFALRVRGEIEKFFNLLHLETWLSSWQKEKIERNPKTHIEGSLIEANDEALIFLPRPRGPRVFQKFKERLNA